MKYLTIPILILITTACVTQKKYNELLAEKVQLEGELSMSRDSLEDARHRIDRLESELARAVVLRDSVTELKELSDEQIAELQAQYDELDTYYNNLLNNSGKLSQDLEEQRERLLLLKDDLDAARRENEALAADLQSREAKVQELEDILARKDEAVRELKNRISKALLNFEENDLTVEMKGGKVYVSLAEQLLFNSGSVVVDSKGKKALRQLASALQGQKDISIMVEGHTDNVPVSRTSQYMNDNWDLSVMRATSIVRILTEAGVSPTQISAAGKGEFSPVATNETPEGRSRNRRTEIVITPDLSELFEILETDPGL